jgi:large subunit ribosomal protein L21
MKDKMAIISLGGKQHIVQVGTQLAVNRLVAEVGAKLDTTALLVADGEKITVGTPEVDKAKVSLKVLEHSRGTKVTVSRFKAKSRYRRKLGHRQPLTSVEVLAIKV